jgi:TRAP-type uncharacterized transport system substrate-binding protein
MSLFAAADCRAAIALMRSHFAGIGNRMTINGQRLDPPWRAYAAVQQPTRGGMREIGVRGRTCAALLIAAALFPPSLAHAAGPSPSQLPLAPQAQEAAPAEPVAAPAPTDAEPRHNKFRPTAATSTQKPPGMVLYDKPVFRNGVRVLWHGAWRDGSGAAGEAAAKPAPAKPHDFLIVADSADASATRMAVEFAGAMQNGGQHVLVVSGGASAAALDKAVNGDAADFAIAPLDGLIESGKMLADKDPTDWRERTPYLLRLSNEPIELIAPRAIADIGQLAGRKVNVGAPDGAAAASAAIIFSRLNVTPTLTNEYTQEALADLKGGLIDAVFLVGGNDSKALADFDMGDRFHVVAIPYAPALQALYSPMRLTARERPGLIGADEKVDTIGVTTALFAIDAPPNSPRAARIAPLANQLFSGFEQLRGASDNSNWKEVNLTARIFGWPRLDAAQSWLDQNQTAPNAALDAFRAMAQTAAGEGAGPSAADSDRLYESLMQWSGAAQ